MHLNLPSQTYFKVLNHKGAESTLKKKKERKIKQKFHLLFFLLLESEITFIDCFQRCAMQTNRDQQQN